MGAIHVSGSIALFLFGGVVAWFGLFGIIYGCNAWSCVTWPGYVLLFAGIGMIIGGVVLARRSSKSAQRKPAETKESESNFCDNCGKSLRLTAKFCSGCGTPRS